VHSSAGAACLAARNRENDTPLHLAVLWPGYVQLLLSLGADVSAVNDARETPLHAAAEAGAELSVQLLLDAGAAVNAANCNGEQPLHLAARAGHWQVLRLLLSRGADVHAASHTWLTATRLALMCGDSVEERWLELPWRCLQLLVEARADLQQYSPKYGTLLHTSVSILHPAVTQYLLDRLLPLQPHLLNRTTAQGHTALYCAVAASNAALVRLLLASGADARVDSSPLLHACFKSAGSGAATDLAMFNMLLDAGAIIMQLNRAR
jgi:ankyrin repeat protein